MDPWRAMSVAMKLAATAHRRRAYASSRPWWCVSSRAKAAEAADEYRAHLDAMREAGLGDVVAAVQVSVKAAAKAMQEAV